MKKSNKKIKIKKKDLDKFSPDRIMSDFDSVNSVLSNRFFWWKPNRRGCFNITNRITTNRKLFK